MERTLSVATAPRTATFQMRINPEVKNFYDFTLDDFKLIDYQYHEFKEKIPVAI